MKDIQSRTMTIQDSHQPACTTVSSTPTKKCLGLYARNIHCKRLYYHTQSFWLALLRTKPVHPFSLDSVIFDTSQRSWCQPPLLIRTALEGSNKLSKSCVWMYFRSQLMDSPHHADKLKLSLFQVTQNGISIHVLSYEFLFIRRSNIINLL